MSIHLLRLFLLFCGAQSFTLQTAHTITATPKLAATNHAWQIHSPTNSFPRRPTSVYSKMAEDAKVGSKSKKVVTPEKIAGRKKRLKTVYKLVIAKTGILSAVIYAKCSNPFYTMGFVLAGGVSYILLGAAVNNRLSSDTYKRLNLGLFTYGLFALFAGNFMKFPKIWSAACIITMINSIKGYGYGLKGWELKPTCAKEDFLNGIKSNTKTLLKIPNLNSAGYLAGTITLATLLFTKCREIINAIQSSTDTYMMGESLFRLSIFYILTLIMFTLKDASDRNRLEGTTFIELNAMTSVSFAAWALEGYRNTGFVPLHAGASVFFSILSGFNALSSTLKKKA
mmetsp:Transcript_3238/g.4721  ORF Transcript_3238/g.4721 Transcript_3238/m.4721 type:complete len:340 (-) Transcript_3238:47-1066(-)